MEVLLPLVGAGMYGAAIHWITRLNWPVSLGLGAAIVAADNLWSRRSNSQMLPQLVVDTNTFPEEKVWV